MSGGFQAMSYHWYRGSGTKCPAHFHKDKVLLPPAGCMVPAERIPVEMETGRAWQPEAASLATLSSHPQKLFRSRKNRLGQH